MCVPYFLYPLIPWWILRLFLLLIVVQSLSHVQLFATPWTAACQASLSFTISQSWFRFMSTELMMLCNYLILSCSPFLLPSVFPSIRVFSNEFALHIRWPKYWRFSFSISPSNEYSGLISFRIDWFDLLQSKGLSRTFSSTRIQKHQFFSTQMFLRPTLTSIYDYWRNHSFDYTDLCWQSDVFAF